MQVKTGVLETSLKRRNLFPLSPLFISFIVCVEL